MRARLETRLHGAVVRYELRFGGGVDRPGLVGCGGGQHSSTTVGEGVNISGWRGGGGGGLEPSEETIIDRYPGDHTERFIGSTPLFYLEEFSVYNSIQTLFHVLERQKRK